MAAETEKQYWITGAGSGIGLELARKLCGQGHRVIATGRTREKLEALCSEFPQLVTVVPADVSDDKQMSVLFDDFLPDRIDGVFLCAGICEYIDLPEINIASIRRVMDVNFHGIVNACKSALPLMLPLEKTEAGSRPFIAGISSMSTYVGFPRAEAYGSSKAAMTYFLDSLRTDVGRKVDITVVYPGFVETPLTSENDFAMPTMVSADYAASYILKKIVKRPHIIRFPWRLHVMLKMASLFTGLWYRKLAPRLSRYQAVHQESGK